MTEHVKTEIADGIMTLTLARADKKNALSNAMYSAMSDGLERAEKDPAVRVVLFQGDGDSFTAGNDLADFSAQANGQDTGESQAFRFINNLGKATRPLIAAVQGNAVGVGTTMLLHCDLVFLADTAKLMTPFVNLALVPEAASSWLLPARIGHVRATPCLRWANRLMRQPRSPAVWPTPWCRQRICAPAPGRPRRR
jgi:enoyl-CoA hydratase/carnithine racemase